MKIFYNTKNMAEWLNQVAKDTKTMATKEVAEQAYKDSVKYTFYDTGEMYDSGKDSDFGNGYVVIKAPQVRRLYYTNWAKNKTNPTSTPMWWEATKRENVDSYKKIVTKIFNKRKEQ